MTDLNDSFHLYRFDYLGQRFGRRLVARLLEEELGPPRAARRVLDVGSGTGAWRPVLEGHARDYVGLDLKPGPAVQVVASAEAMPFADDQFDLVFSNAMLEHVRDYRAAVAEMFRVVKPEGLVLLGTHGVWELHGEPHDYWRWTPHGLRETFRAFAETRVVQLGGPWMNYFLLRNLYLRRWQERHPRLRALVSPFMVWNNLLGRSDAERREPPAALAVFYYVLAKKNRTGPAGAAPGPAAG
ncbi:MAG: class I SAM-dependent methyltransferase [Kiritimatiellae bacterium]|nr:class I SAM-dependent methyltransferase [Kiritimatiellia bacterium]